jgi:hypothetical protein
MLQRMQSQDGQRSRIGMVENAKHAALLMQRVAIVTGKIPDMLA